MYNVCIFMDRTCTMQGKKVCVCKGKYHKKSGVLPSLSSKFSLNSFNEPILAVMQCKANSRKGWCKHRQPSQVTKIHLSRQFSNGKRPRAQTEKNRYYTLILAIRPRSDAFGPTLALKCRIASVKIKFPCDQHILPGHGTSLGSIEKDTSLHLAYCLR